MKSIQANQPIVIAGPCLAESYELLDEVASHLVPLAKELKVAFYFKASFDKANRSALDNARGPGIEQAMEWFARLKKQYGCKILTDVHEAWQIPIAAEQCDALQIPAFLCRQTDLVLEAVKSGCFVNIKKGQFMAPAAMQHVVKKAASIYPDDYRSRVSVTERGFSFGYGDLVVDMRALKTLAEAGCPVLLDVTHSTQKPPAGTGNSSGGARNVAPLLARAATATGYLDGYFLEVHSRPDQAQSDSALQLTVKQGETLLRQLLPLWKQSKEWKVIDSEFE